MTFKNPEGFHQKISFAFHAMLALPLAVFVYLFLEIKNRHLEPALSDPQINSVLNIVLPILAIIIFAYGYYLHRKRLKEVNKNKKLRDKLPPYFKASLIFYAFIEVASVLLVGGLYLTTSAIFIVGYVLILFLMSLNRPTPQKYVKDLTLTKEDQDIILHKGEFSDNESPGNHRD